MNIVLIGPPASGKSTVGNLLHTKLKIPFISSGHLMRELLQKGETKKVIGTTLTPDTQIIPLVLQRLKQPDCENGFILDGFPRTMSQVTALKQAGIQLNYILHIDLPDSECIKRTAGRRIDAVGNVYNVNFNPPPPDLAVTTRADDAQDNVAARLADYHRQTAPLIAEYLQQARSDKLSVITVTSDNAELNAQTFFKNVDNDNVDLNNFNRHHIKQTPKL